LIVKGRRKVAIHGKENASTGLARYRKENEDKLG
jgi:hypothetical protein